MKKLLNVWGIGALALGLTVITGAARAQQTQPDIPGPIDSLQDLQDTGKMIFKLADENGDNQISQKEAIDAGNLVVGGFFFRADANGDGTLNSDEAKSARDAFFRDRPWAKYVVDTMKAESQKQGAAAGNTAQNTNAAVALKSIASAFDTNNDKQLQATELRQAVQTTVQGLFASADTNRDGQLSPTEVNSAMIGGARAVAQATFQKADANNDGSLSEEEFNESLKQPVHVMFTIMDLNNDGKISQEEMQRARRAVISRLQSARLPEAENSLRNMIRTGRKPGEVAPVPSFGTPAAPGGARPAPGAQPAPAPAPAPAPR